MNAQHRTVITILAALMTLLTMSGCGFITSQVKVGELQTRSESVELADAKAVKVDINMGAGQLNLSGGASKLLQAKFTYNVAELNPQVTYSGGALNVLTPKVTAGISSLGNIDNYRNEWEVQLSDNVPMELRVEVGAGSADLKLGSLAMTKLDLNTGAAPVTVDLIGNWQADLDAKITGGLGDLTLRLPGRVCARVSIKGGIGLVEAQGFLKDGRDYVNAACGGSAVTLRINISAGVSTTKLELGE